MIRILVILFTCILSTLSIWAQKDSNKSLVNIAVEAILDHKYMQKATFEYEGSYYVFFEASHDWEDSEFQEEGKHNGVKYKIWWKKDLFFYGINYVIHFDKIEKSESDLSVKYGTRQLDPEIVRDNLSGTLIMKKKNGVWKRIKNNLARELLPNSH